MRDSCSYSETKRLSNLNIYKSFTGKNGWCLSVNKVAFAKLQRTRPFELLTEPNLLHVVLISSLLAVPKGNRRQDFGNNKLFLLLCYCTDKKEPEKQSWRAGRQAGWLFFWTASVGTLPYPWKGKKVPVLYPNKKFKIPSRFFEPYFYWNSEFEYNSLKESAVWRVGDHWRLWGRILSNGTRRVSSDCLIWK